MTFAARVGRQISITARVGMVSQHIHVPAELSNFEAFYTSSRNPCLRAWDPKDQRELLDAVRSIHAPGASLEILFAVCCLAGLLGRPDSVRALGALAAAGSTEAFEKEVQVPWGTTARTL